MTQIRFMYAKNIHTFALFGHIIRWFERLTTGLDASHCMVEITCDSDCFIVESIFPKGRIVKNYDYKNKYKIVESFTFHTEKSLEEILNYCRTHIENKPYSLWQNIELGFLGLIVDALKFKNWSYKEQLELNGRNVQNCSEVQIMLAQYIFNIHPTEGLDQYSVGEARDLIYSIYLLRGTRWQYSRS